MCVCMHALYVCMYVCTYVHMHARIYVCMWGGGHIFIKHYIGIAIFSRNIVPVVHGWDDVSLVVHYTGLELCLCNCPRMG